LGIFESPQDTLLLFIGRYHIRASGITDRPTVT
jgi:hypothetical protein